MKYYVEVRIRPDIEFNPTILMNEVFFRLHKVLFNLGNSEVGLSFPEVNITLGSLVRLHGDEIKLQEILSTSWADDILDYVEISKVSPIPNVSGYRVVRRVQIKSNPERLLRRSVKKGWISEEEAVQRLQKESPKSTSLPYIKLKSFSTGQMFRLYIEHGPVLENPVDGEFSDYGLSSSKTVPWF
jgi:CRISPR-associated endonuclease Csy4